MNTRGDLTSTQIITLVLAIIGFGVVLYFLFFSNLGGYSAEETCHLSVLTRATAPSITKSIVPLKCVTKKICLTEGSSGCEAQFAGEKDVEYVKLKGSDADKIRTIEETSANAMYDCWSMMGEGKLDLFGDFFGSEKATCVICSRVAVDNKVNRTRILDYVDVDAYMQNQQIPGSSLTYLQTFTDRGVNSYATFKPEAFKTLNRPEEEFQGNVNYDVAFVFSQIQSRYIGDVLGDMLKIGGTLGAATFMSPVGKYASKLLFTPKGLIVAGTAAIGAGAYGYYRANKAQKAASGYCGKFSSQYRESDKQPSGCSIVQAVSYNFKDVNEICDGSIQGEI